MFERNDKCFCESGKKFKDCCGSVLLKEKGIKEVSFKPYEIRQIEGDLLNISKKNTCLYPGCTNPAINSHSIQNSRFLKLLSKNGHVLQFDINLKGSTADFLLGDKGINTVASTFYGFCNIHDSPIFKKIEIGNNIFSTPEQYFLFAYRALAHSLYTSKEMYKFRTLIAKKKPMIVYSPQFQEDVINQKEIRESFQLYKNVFDQALLTSNWGELETILLIVNKPSLVAVSSCFSLPFDLRGNYLFQNDRPKKMMMTVCSEDKKTYALFSWIKKEERYFNTFRKQLLSLSEQQIVSLINNIIPFYCENYFIAHELWETFSTEAKEELIKVSSNFFQYRLAKNFLGETKYSFYAH
ncbi:SEC-C motif protein [compost metagenome]